MSSAIGSRPAKDALFDTFARVAASLAAGRRLEIIDVLAQAPRTVDDLATAIGQTIANTSHHLRRMATDGLVTADKHGRHITYRLASPHVHQLWQALQYVAAAHHRGLEPLAQAYLGDRNQIQQINRDTLQRRMRQGEVVVIDVRPETEYQAGHIDGAINIPPHLLDQLLPQLPTGRDIVAYCRGSYCAYADQAVRQLQTSGHTAYRLEHGYPEWHRIRNRPAGPDHSNDAQTAATPTADLPADGAT